jgi:hypothetical protein
MHGFRHALLFTIVLGTFSSGVLLAQRGGGGARTTLPSSTAIGAGALSAFPSSTARSAAPAIGRSGYGRSGYGYGSRNYAGAYANRGYRPLPRSYFLAPYYYPFFDWSGGTDYSNGPYDSSGYGYGPDPGTDQMMMNQAAMGQQLSQLSAQVNNLMYGPNNAPAPAADQQTPPPPPVTLVLRSGERLKVENYAIAGSTFWDFTQAGARKIPLSNIDLAASARATEATGAEFPQITATP